MTGINIEPGAEPPAAEVAAATDPVGVKAKVTGIIGALGMQMAKVPEVMVAQVATTSPEAGDTQEQATPDKPLPAIREIVKRYRKGSRNSEQRRPSGLDLETMYRAIVAESRVRRSSSSVAMDGARRSTTG